jgi:hypothetical protein
MRIGQSSRGNLRDVTGAVDSNRRQIARCWIAAIEADRPTDLIRDQTKMTQVRRRKSSGFLKNARRTVPEKSPFPSNRGGRNQISCDQVGT